MSEFHVLYRLPMVRGGAYYTFAIESNPFTTVKRDGPGFIGKEVAARKAAKLKPAI